MLKGESEDEKKDFVEIDNDVLKIEHITVRQDRIICEVRIEKESFRHTTPALIAQLCKDFPDLPNHTCKNSKGDTFSSVMNNTSLPHLFEHLVIDLQTRECANVKKTFVGTSEWLDKSEGIARIEVNFTDDMNALRAFRQASQILNKAMI